MAVTVHPIRRGELLEAIAVTVSQDDPRLTQLVSELEEITGGHDGVVEYNERHAFEIVRTDGSHERVSRQRLYQALVEKYFGDLPVAERGILYEALMAVMPPTGSIAAMLIEEGGSLCYGEGTTPFSFPQDLLSVSAVLMTIDPGGFPWGHYPTVDEFPNDWLVSIAEGEGVTTLGFEGEGSSRFVELETDSMRVVVKGGRLFLVGTNAKMAEDWELPLPLEHPGAQILLRNDSARNDSLSILLQVAVGANTAFLQSMDEGVRFSLNPQQLLVRTHSLAKVVGLFPLEDPEEPPFLGFIEFDPTGNHRFHVAYRDSFHLRQRDGVWEIEYETLTPIDGFNLVRSLALHQDHDFVREWVAEVTAGGAGPTGGSQEAIYPVSPEQLEALLARQPLSAAESREEGQIRRAVHERVTRGLPSMDYSLRRVLIELLYRSDPDEEADDDDDNSSGRGGAGGAAGGSAGGMTTKGPGPGPFRAAGVSYRSSGIAAPRTSGGELLGAYSGELVFERPGDFRREASTLLPTTVDHVGGTRGNELPRRPAPPLLIP